MDSIGEWTFGEDEVVATNESGSDWTIAEDSGSPMGDCILRAKIQARGSCWGVKLRYGSAARLMVLGQGTFIYSIDGPAGSTDNYEFGGTEVDLVLRIESGHAQAYVNGKLLLEADIPDGEHSLGIGISSGV